MCNCFLYLQKLISHTKKIILVLLLQLTVFSFTAAVDYFWTGNSGIDNNWETASNWSNTLGGTAASDYPKTASDNAYFPRTATINLNSDVTVAAVSIPNPNEETSDFTIKVSGSSKITANKIDNVRAAGAGAGATAKSKFIFDCDVKTPMLYCHSGADYEITTGHTAEITDFNFPGMSLESVFTVNGILKTTKNLQLFDTGNYYQNQIKISPASTGTLETSGNLSVESEFQTDSLEIKCNNLVTKENFKCKRIDVSGTTEIHKWFITDSSGVTSTFTGTVTTKGSSGNQILILDHSGATPCSIPLAIENTGGTLILHNSEIEVTGSNIDSGASSYELKINVPVTFTGNPVIQNASKVVFDAGCTSVSGSGTKSFNTDVEIVGTVAMNSDIIVSGNFTDGGTVSGTGKITLNGNSTSGKKDQTFKASATSNYGTIVINKTEGKVDFNSSNILKATKITVTQSEETDFTGKFEVSEIETNSSSGIIDFKTSDGKINGDFTAASQIKVSSGKLTITGDFVNNADLQIASGASLYVKGNVDDSSGTSWTGTGIFQFTGTQNQSFINKAGRTYPSLSVKLSTGKTVTVSDSLLVTDLSLASGNIVFQDDVTITGYSETSIPSGNISFNGTALIKNGAAFQTTGTVTVAASKKLSADSNRSFTFKNTAVNGTIETTGTGTQTYNGTTRVGSSGNISSAAAINFGNASVTELEGAIQSTGSTVTFGTNSVITVKSASASITGTEIKAAAIKTDTASTNEITLKATSGKFTLGQIGELSRKLAKVTLDSDNNDFVSNYNGADKIYSLILEFKNSNSKNISLTGLKLDGELQLNSSGEVLLSGGASKMEAGKISFTATPSAIKLSGEIEVTGTGGFISPSTPAITLTGNTKITASGTSAPITLYDSLLGTGYTLEVSNNGAFTLNDATPSVDPVNIAAAPASALDVKSFSQTGAGNNLIYGDISASGNISFSTDIEIFDNLSCKSSDGNISFGGKIDGNYLLVTESKGNTSFSGAAGSSTPLNNFSVTAANAELSSSLTVASSSDITFALGASGTEGTLTVKGNDSSISGQKLKIITNGNLYINKSAGKTVTVNPPVEISGSLSVVTGTADFKDKITVNKSFNNGSGAEIKTADELEVKGDFTDAGTFTETSGSKITLTGTANQTFAPGSAVTYKNLTVNKTAGTLEFISNTLNVTDLTFTQAHGTTFNTAVGITTFADSSSAGDLNFSAGGAVTNPVNFATAGAVLFGSDSTHTFTFGSSSPYAAVTHTTGITGITGTLTAASVVFGDSGSVAGTKINLTGKIFTSGNQTFNSLVYGGDMIFEGSAITVNQQISSLGKVTVTNSGIFTLSDITSITDESTSDLTCSAFTQNGTGYSDLSGDIKVLDVVNAPDGKINFAKNIKLSGNVKITASGDVSFTDKIESNSPLLNFIVEGTNVLIYRTADISGNMIVTNSGLFKAFDSFSFGQSFVQNGAGLVMLGGDLKSTAATGASASFEKSVYLYGSQNVIIGSAGLSAINCSENIIISKSSAGKTVTLNSPLICSNFVLYCGDLSLYADVTSSNDMIFLGDNYSTKDEITGVTDVYVYYPRPLNWSQPLYNSLNFCAWETSFPDSSAFAVSEPVFGGKVSLDSDVVLHSGKNFYANGVNMSLTPGAAGTNWYIDILQNTIASDCFAESYNCNISNATVRCHTGPGTTGTGSADKAQVVFEPGEKSGICDPSCVNFDTVDLELVKAYTVRDNSIRVEFNKPVRKINSIQTLLFSDGNFTDIYSNPDCTEDSKVNDDVIESYNSSGNDYYYCYLKSSDSWNTDATGKDIGLAESTDRYGIHKSALPYIDLPRDLTDASGAGISNYVVTDLFGKRSKNYSTRTPVSGISWGSSADAVNDVDDKAGPVLISVKTGQENHTPYDAAAGKDSQKSYDAHNFLEFRYSEQVNFGDSDSSKCDVWMKYDDLDDAENVKVAENFGALQGEISSGSNLHFAGLAVIDTGKIYTGSKGAVDKYVNALYRFDSYSLRYSVAGYTEGVYSDSLGNQHLKWKGYIESVEMPSGAVTAVSSDNPLVKDILGNHQTMVKPGLAVDSEKNGVYGKWDVSKPVFAPLRMKSSVAWGNTDYYEAVGNSSGSGSTLDKIEFHLFDNTPKYNTSDDAVWFTERGWCINADFDGEPILKTEDSYCADIFGGSRQFDATDRTSGGIRFSSLENATAAFKYTTNLEELPQTLFDNGKQPVFGARGAIFTGNSTLRRAATSVDGLYFGIPLADKSLPVSSTFLVSYNSNEGFITDLAGNRLESTVIKTLDRSTPLFNLILSPLNQKEILMVFVKKLSRDGIKLYDNNGSPIYISEKLETLLPRCFQIVSIAEDGTPVVNETIAIDADKPAEIIKINEEDKYTAFKLTLTRDITFSDVKNLYYRVVNPQEYNFPMCDPVTDIPDTRVTLIQDDIGNYIEMYKAHAFSDIAVNSLNPLYAYNTDMNYDGENIMNGLYEEGSWAVHNWNADQQNYGTLISDNAVTIVADVDENTKRNDDFDGYLRVYLSNNPDESSVSKKFNEEIGASLRVWLPKVGEDILSAFALENNSNFLYSNSRKNKEGSFADGLSFDISKEGVSTWKSGDQITFLFGYMNPDGTPFKVYTTPAYDINTGKYDLSTSPTFPLYALRLLTENILSLDLWSFRLKNLTEQRGGVTVLNNVINASVGEKVVVKVNVPQNGKVNVMVMTLDGNIVTYLHRGAVTAGEHYFSWNGKNNAGSKVARGMYFIRVAGTGIDETRKVMVVKD